jgi:ornithine cyclodeaminase/alanine dehydrogenase-like protein (mu-crystallin family)
MSANLISAMRTGAIPGVGAKYLAREDAQVIGMVGGGVISRTCLMALADVLKNVKEVKVYDVSRKNMERYCKDMTEKIGVKVYAVDSLAEAVKGSDVVNLATSGQKAPSIKSEWLKEGSMLSLPASVELEEEFLLENKVVVDNWKMYEAWRAELQEMPGGSHA